MLGVQQFSQALLGLGERLRLLEMGTCLGHVEQETASSLRFGSCRRAHGSRTFVTDLLSLGALWHTARDRHTGGVCVYPVLPKQRAAGSACLLQALQKSHCLWNYSQLMLEHMV